MQTRFSVFPSFQFHFHFHHFHSANAARYVCLVSTVTDGMADAGFALATALVFLLCRSNICVCDNKFVAFDSQRS